MNLYLVRMYIGIIDYIPAICSYYQCRSRLMGQLCDNNKHSTQSQRYEIFLVPAVINTHFSSEVNILAYVQFVSTCKEMTRGASISIFFHLFFWVWCAELVQSNGAEINVVIVETTLR